MNRVSLMTWKCSDDAKYADYGSKTGTGKILWHLNDAKRSIHPKVGKKRFSVSCSAEIR